MAQLNATDTVALQLEAVSKTVPLLVEKEGKLDARFKDMGRAERVSTRNYRITMQTALPGAVAKVNLDGGDFPRGGHSQYDVGTITPLAFCVPLEMSLLAKMTGKGEGIAVDDVVSKNIADCISSLAKFRDQFLQTDGTGNIGTISAVSGPDGNGRYTLTLSGSFGARLVNKQQTIQIFNGTTLRGSTTVYDVSSDLGATQQVITDGNVAGMTTGDTLRVDGVENGSPVFVNGIPVFHSTSSSGSVIGISRAQSYVRANGVNAAGGAITQPMFRLAKNKNRQALGDEGMKGLIAHTHPSQVQSWEEIGYSIMTIPFANGARVEGAFDPTINNDQIRMDGLEVIQNIHAAQDRVDLLNPRVWGKVTWSDGPFWFDLEGQKVWPIYASGGNGSLSSAFISFLIDTLQYYVDNMKACASITSLSVPSGN